MKNFTRMFVMVMVVVMASFTYVSANMTAGESLRHENATMTSSEKLRHENTQVVEHQVTVFEANVDDTDVNDMTDSEKLRHEKNTTMTDSEKLRHES